MPKEKPKAAKDMSQDELLAGYHEALQQYRGWRQMAKYLRQELDDRVVSTRFGKGQGALAKQRRARKGVEIGPPSGRAKLRVVPK